MKFSKPDNTLPRLGQMIGVLIVVVLCVILAIKLRALVGGSWGTLIFALVLGVLGYGVRRYFAHAVGKKD